MNQPDNYVTEHALTTIWRYTPMWKFKSMLENEALWFCRLDQLEDPQEGRTPQSWLRMFYGNADNRRMLAGAGILNRTEAAPISEGTLPAYVQHVGTAYLEDITRMTVCVNCWHERDTESERMWNEYLKGEPGVAVKSNVGCLDRALGEQKRGGKYSNDFCRLVSPVCYVGENEPMPDIPNAFLTKDPKFEHERELRITWIHDLTFETEAPKGIQLGANLDTLIKEIRVFPNAPDDFVATVKAAVEECGLQKPVMKSDL